jgi:hypothetical protein
VWARQWCTHLGAQDCNSQKLDEACLIFQLLNICKDLCKNVHCDRKLHRTQENAGTIKICFSRTPKCKLVVFMTTCDSVEMHHLLLSTEYQKACGHALTLHPVLKLHGNMDATDRTGELLLCHTCLCWSSYALHEHPWLCWLLINATAQVAAALLWFERCMRCIRFQDLVQWSLFNPFLQVRIDQQ